MGLEYYAFATYVFILLCIGMWLFFRQYKKAGKKAKEKDKTGFEKEQRLFTLYQNIEDLLVGFEEYVEESKNEAQNARAEIAKLLDEARRICIEEKAGDDEPQDAHNAPMLQSLPRASSAVRAAYQAAATKAVRNEIKEPVLEIIKPYKENNPVIQDDKPGEWNMMKTVDKVTALCEKGLSKTQIAQQLAISVREVTLVMKMRNVQ